MALDTVWAQRWMENCAEIVHARREELIELDREIGDGDHGENLDRGFRAVQEKLLAASCATPQEVLQLVAKTLLSAVGGASGPLLGTAFLRAAKAASAGSLDAEVSLAVLQAAQKGIQDRGKAVPGEKTMVDAWAAAVEAAVAATRDAERSGEKIEAAAIWVAAAAGAKEGAESTLSMQATKGRASYLGERSIGHLDPGAVSTSYILAAAAEAAVSESERK